MATAAPAIDNLLSTADIAERFGVSVHVIRVICDRLGIGSRIRNYRVVPAEHLPKIEIAIIGGGYQKRGADRPQAVGA